MSIFPESVKRVLVTGGAGFIGSNLIRKLFVNTSCKIFNLDKLSYASDLTAIKEVISNRSFDRERYQFLKVNLSNSEATNNAIIKSDPDWVFHLAAESHVDRSISSPQTFLESNVIGTFNLLEALKTHWESLPIQRKKHFRMLHVSTDEVFGSVEEPGIFSESSSYSPRSPYSATKAASDHFVKAWHHTYGIPAIVTNSGNNFGPWQFPEKLIPVIIKNAISNEPIPLYGNGKNIRDWIYVDDHIEALLKVISQGKIGTSYCIGAGEQKSNEEVVRDVCNLLDKHLKRETSVINLKKYVQDRLGHDEIYKIDNTKIKEELNWTPKYAFNDGLCLTVKWYIGNTDWCRKVRNN